MLRTEEFLDRISPLGITIRVGAMLLLSLAAIVIGAWHECESPPLAKWLLIDGVTMLSSAGIGVLLLVVVVVVEDTSTVAQSLFQGFVALVNLFAFAWGVLGCLLLSVTHRTCLTNGSLLGITSVVAIAIQLFAALYVWFQKRPICTL